MEGGEGEMQGREAITEDEMNLCQAAWNGNLGTLTLLLQKGVFPDVHDVCLESRKKEEMRYCEE